jgi:hypothetical protein
MQKRITARIIPFSDAGSPPSRPTTRQPTTVQDLIPTKHRHYVHRCKNTWKTQVTRLRPSGALSNETNVCRHQHRHSNANCKHRPEPWDSYEALGDRILPLFQSRPSGALRVPEPEWQIEAYLRHFLGSSKHILTPLAVCARCEQTMASSLKSLEGSSSVLAFDMCCPPWIMACSTSHKIHNRDLLAFASDHYPKCFLTLLPLASPTMTGSGTTLRPGWRAPFAAGGS